MRSTVCLLRRRLDSSSNISSRLAWMVSRRRFFLTSLSPLLPSFSITFSTSRWMRRTLSMTRHTRSVCHFSSNSASSSSMSLTTSLTRTLPLRSLSPISRSSSMAALELSTAWRILRSPSSMRLAISTSPSRVSSETEPILRRYMRTGSLVRE